MIQGSHSEENLLGKKKSMDSNSKISLETHILNSYNPIYTIKYLVKKNFWLKKNIGQKKYWSKKIWSKKYLVKKNIGKKNIWSKKYICSKKNLVNKILSKKNFWSQNFW